MAYAVDQVIYGGLYGMYECLVVTAEMWIVASNILFDRLAQGEGGPQHIHFTGVVEPILLRPDVWCYLLKARNCE